MYSRYLRYFRDMTQTVFRKNKSILAQSLCLWTKKWFLNTRIKNLVLFVYVFYLNVELNLGDGVIKYV